MAIYNPDSFFHSPKLYESGLDCFGDFIPIGMPNCRCSHYTLKVLDESVFRFLRDSSKSAIFMPFYLVIVDEIQMEEQLLWCNSSRNDAERKNFLVCHPAKMAIFKTLWHIFFHSCVLQASSEGKHFQQHIFWLLHAWVYSKSADIISHLYFGRWKNISKRVGMDLC